MPTETTRPRDDAVPPGIAARRIATEALLRRWAPLLATHRADVRAAVVTHRAKHTGHRPRGAHEVAGQPLTSDASPRLIDTRTETPAAEPAREHPMTTPLTTDAALTALLARDHDTVAIDANDLDTVATAVLEAIRSWDGETLINSGRTIR